MFSLTRPSPAQKCALSSSSSYVPLGCARKSCDGVLSGSGLRQPAGTPADVQGPTVPGSALCEMSVRNGVSKCTTFDGTGTGLAVLPSTRPVFVTYCGSPRAGPGMNLPYGSAAIIGTFVTSVSLSSRPSFVAACCLTAAHVAMPVVPSGEPA